MSTRLHPSSLIRAPHVPIFIVLVVLFLDLTTYKEWIDWQWPFERWTMYEKKAKTKPVADWRRFVAYDDSGKSFAIDLGRAFAFLGKPYRLDRGIRKAKAAFLRRCLEALRANEGTHIVGLAYERRSWRYLESSLEEHLDTEVPAASYTLIAVDPPPPALRAAATGNILANGTFSKVGRSGKPRSWSFEGGVWLGLGIDFEGKEQSVLLAKGSERHALSQEVAAPDEPVGSPVSIHFSVLVRATGTDALAELAIRAGEKEVARLSAPGPADGQWHRLEIAHELPVLPSDATLRVELVNPGPSTVFFDDAVLVVRPAAPAPVPTE